MSIGSMARRLLLLYLTVALCIVASHAIGKTHSSKPAKSKALPNIGFLARIFSDANTAWQGTMKLQDTNLRKEVQAMLNYSSSKKMVSIVIRQKDGTFEKPNVPLRDYDGALRYLESQFDKTEAEAAKLALVQCVQQYKVIVNKYNKEGNDGAVTEPDSKDRKVYDTLTKVCAISTRSRVVDVYGLLTVLNTKGKTQGWVKYHTQGRATPPYGYGSDDYDVSVEVTRTQKHTFCEAFDNVFGKSCKNVAEAGGL